MINKKHLVGYILTLILAITYIVICFTTPFIRMILNDHANLPGSQPILDNNYTIFSLFNSMLIFEGDFYSVWLNSAGPSWFSIFTISCYLLVLTGCAVLVICSIIGIIKSIKNKQISDKSRASRVCGLFTGYFGLVLFVISIIGYSILNKMAMGYIASFILIGQYICAVLSLLIIVSTYISTQKAESIVPNKVKSCIAYFAVAVIAGVLSILLLGAQFTEYLYGPETLTIFVDGFNELFLWNSLASIMVYVCGGFLYASEIALTFLFVYSLIGGILVLCNKNTNWLSKNTKRLAIETLIFCSIYFCLVFLFPIMEVGSIIDVCFFETNVHLVNPIIYILMFIPFVLVILSQLIPYKKIKRIKAQKAEQIINAVPLNNNL